MKFRSDLIPFVLAALPLFVCHSAFAAPQKTSAKKEAATVLTVRGVAEKPVTLTAADLEKLPLQSVKVKDKGGEEHTYEGVSLGDTLKRAGMNFQADLHGRALTRYLLAEAADKYRIVFALPEFDPAFTNRLILVAVKRDGVPLSAEEGPFRLLVPDEKRQARWVRQLRVLTLADAVSPADQNKKP